MKANRKEIRTTTSTPSADDYGTLEYLQYMLEKLVDDYGIQNVLDELSTTCANKAEHLNVNWQDYPGGVLWSYYADNIRALSYIFFQQHKRSSP